MVFAQNDGRLHLPPLAEQSQDMGVPAKTPDQVEQERLMKTRQLRQEEIRRDTQKLYQLSGELKDYLDKNGSVILSAGHDQEGPRPSRSWPTALSRR